MDPRPKDEIKFRKMSPAQFEALDPATKEEAVRAYHLGTIRACERLIFDQLMKGLATPLPGPDGAPGGPPALEDLVAVVMHRDDPVMTHPALAPMRAAWVAQDLEVGAFVSARAGFAEGVASLEFDGARPYAHAGRTLGETPPPGTFYVATFAMGMCTVLVLGFDPATSGPPAEAPAAPPPA